MLPSLASAFIAELFVGSQRPSFPLSSLFLLILAAHGTGRSAQHRRHRPSRMAAGQPQTEGFRLVSTHTPIRSHSHDNTGALSGLKECTWS